MNLIIETIECLKEHNKEPKDIVWVGDVNGEFAMDWLGFVNAFGNFTYDNGYGTAMVTDQLVVVGEDWWLERHEYDGAEWWEYKEKPQVDLQAALPFSPKENGEFQFPNLESEND